MAYSADECAQWIASNYQINPRTGRKPTPNDITNLNQACRLHFFYEFGNPPDAKSGAPSGRPPVAPPVPPRIGAGTSVLIRGTDVPWKRQPIGQPPLQKLGSGRSAPVVADPPKPVKKLTQGTEIPSPTVIQNLARQRQSQLRQMLLAHEQRLSQRISSVVQQKNAADRERRFHWLLRGHELSRLGIDRTRAVQRAQLDQFQRRQKEIQELQSQKRAADENISQRVNSAQNATEAIHKQRALEQRARQEQAKVRMHRQLQQDRGKKISDANSKLDSLRKLEQVVRDRLARARERLRLRRKG
ncbi:MAG: hypothetical protein ACYCOU_04290 [Sulfobacillus sp.]